MIINASTVWTVKMPWSVRGQMTRLTIMDKKDLYEEIYNVTFIESRIHVCLSINSTQSQMLYCV